VNVDRARRLRSLAWLILGVALIVFAIYEVLVHDLGPAPIVIFLLLPDLALLAGAGQAHARGQLPPRAVPAYNLTHRPVVPITVIAVALVALLAVRLLVQAADQFEADRHLPLLVYVAGIAWLAHIALDRAAGFRLRTPDGWPRDSKPPRH
jgi:Domain of unknown function (DUF4260)